MLTPDKFKDYFMLYEKQLVFYARNLGCNEAVAEEILIQSFSDLWNSQPQLVEASDVESYLFTIVRKKSFVHLRTEKEYTWSRLVLLYKESPKLREDARDEYKILSCFIRVLEGKLPEQEREVHRMYFEHGMTVEEIANQLAILPQAVLDLKSSAMKKMVGKG